MFEGITVTSLLFEGAQVAGAVAIPVSILIALLKVSVVRTRLIWGWILLPFTVVILVAIASLFIGLPFLFLGLILLIGYAPPWIMFAVATYFSVLQIRRFLDRLDRRAGL